MKTSEWDACESECLLMQVRDGALEVVSRLGRTASLTIRVTDEETRRLAELLIGGRRAA
jgi:hypothetical protein